VGALGRRGGVWVVGGGGVEERPGRAAQRVDVRWAMGGRTTPSCVFFVARRCGRRGQRGGGGGGGDCMRCGAAGCLASSSSSFCLPWGAPSSGRKCRFCRACRPVRGPYLGAAGTRGGRGGSGSVLLVLVLVLIVAPRQLQMGETVQYGGGRGRHGPAAPGRKSLRIVRDWSTFLLARNVTRMVPRIWSREWTIAIGRMTSPRAKTTKTSI
jgi:hypothetical protein